MKMRYRSTRSNREAVSASQAILEGLSPDGGLFVPETIPSLPCTPEQLADMDYQETAFEIMKLYLTDYSEGELKACIAAAYDHKFDTDRIVPLAKVEGTYYLELFHGPTIAFKDMALSILPHLMTAAMKKSGKNKETVILTATSGDTGKAALEGFADVPGTRILVFYPRDGVSAIQRQQMLTQRGENTWVIGVDGNFDDCQNGVKAILADKELAEQMNAAGLSFSSANSINIGRLVPQIVYYVYAYARLLREGEIAAGEPINIVVPTGNFGNILAAWYASRMGLPVHRLLCASNENKVLCDFFATGLYDRCRPFILTDSPSMDILVSSNLERLIYELTGRDHGRTAAFMERLAREGSYQIDDSMKERMKIFWGGFATQEEGRQEIRRVFADCGYVMDTHTAVASAVYAQYRRATKDDTKTLIASTASPYKFAPSILRAIRPEWEEQREKISDLDWAFACAAELSRLSGTEIPSAVQELRGAPQRHKLTCSADQMKQMVRDVLKI